MCPRARHAPALVTLAALLVPAAAGTAVAQQAAIDSVFAAYNRTDAPGCAVGVVRNGKLAFARGYGMANLEHGIALSPRSVFRIGSVSKQFTAAAVVLLGQDGAIALDDPVRRHIPELPDYGPEFTIRRLLTHTSGVRDYLVLMDLAGVRGDDYYTDDQVMALLARQPSTNFEPGSEFLYSNSGYFLLSQIVKRATGRTLAEYARARIFEPLGMRHTHFHDDHTRIVPDRATGYAPLEPGDGAGDDAAGAGGRVSSDWRINVTTLPMIGDGGVFTTVEDLALWDRNFDHSTVGGPAFVESMLRRGVLTGGDTLAYALGLGHGTQRGLPIVAHGGGFVGYRAASLRYPGQGVSVYTLCNRADANPSRLAGQVGAALLADRMTPPEPRPDAGPREDETVDTLATTPAELRPFAGAYHSDVLDTTYRVRLEGDTLRLDVGNWLDGPVARVGDDRFRRGPLVLRFDRAPDGAVTGLEVDAGRVRGIRFERVDGR